MGLKYKIEQDHSGSRSLWLVKQGRKVLSQHEFKDDAERTAQRYVAEDRDFAMEGR
jgi:hypothetical protein